MKFSIADLYEKKYTGEMTTRMEWEKKHPVKEHQAKETEKPAVGFGIARAGR